MTPGEELVRQLELLRLRLNESGTERTVGLKDAMGDDCTFYRKSLEKFLTEDYMDLRNHMDNIHELFKTVEGKR